MSDIVQARKLVEDAELLIGQATVLLAQAASKQRLAVSMMVRASPVRRARPKLTVIDGDLKKRVLALVKRYPDKTYHQIADVVGLRNGGRVSEIVNGKR